MTTDRTTKTLLLAIALGLWTQIAGVWLRPTPVQAQAQAPRRDELSSIIALSEIERHTKNIEHDMSSMMLLQTNGATLTELRKISDDTATIRSKMPTPKLWNP